MAVDIFLNSLILGLLIYKMKGCNLQFKIILHYSMTLVPNKVSQRLGGRSVSMLKDVHP